jgi:hypothetical protein
MLGAAGPAGAETVPAASRAGARRAAGADGAEGAAGAGATAAGVAGTGCAGRRGPGGDSDGVTRRARPGAAAGVALRRLERDPPAGASAERRATGWAAARGAWRAGMTADGPAPRGSTIPSPACAAPEGQPSNAITVPSASTLTTEAAAIAVPAALAARVRNPSMSHLTGRGEPPRPVSAAFGL